MANLDESQKALVVRWINEGRKLSEVQSLLASELNQHLTYMEVRFLVDDLKVSIQDPVPEPEPVAEQGVSVPEGAGMDEAGGVRVQIDQVTRPGTFVSGKVTLSDGKVAEWYLDQMGQLGMIPPEEGYKPSVKDMQEFKIQLQMELQRMGF